MQTQDRSKESSEVLLSSNPIYSDVARCIGEFAPKLLNREGNAQSHLMVLTLRTKHPKNLFNRIYSGRNPCPIQKSFGNCVRSTTNLSLGKEEWIVWIFGR